MEKNFILATMQIAIYKKKEDTQTSYLWDSGVKLLPNRLSLSREFEMASVSRKGRNLMDTKVGQMLSTFTKKEESPLKRFKPYSCRTQIWQKAEFPLLLGYGTSGITSESGKIIDTKDLLVFYTPDDWQTMEIYIFVGMGVPESIMEAMEVANEIVKNRKLD